MSQLPQDKITQQFTEGYNKAQELYANDKLQECIDESRLLIAEPAIPRYHRIKTLLMLASTVPDLAEAMQFHKEASLLWHLVRRHYPQGHDVDVDKIMAEMWTALQELKDVLREEASDDNDDDQEGEEEDKELEEQLATYAEVEKERAEQEEFEDKIDAEVLGMSVEDMRAKTASKAAPTKSDNATLKPKLMNQDSRGLATVSTSNVSATSHQPTLSAEAQGMIAASKAFGFGGKPFKSPMLKDTANSPQEPDTAGSVDASEFLLPGGHEALPGRARSLRSKPQSLKLPKRRPQALLKEPTTSESSTSRRPPPVPPRFVTEIFGDTEVSKEHRGEKN
ncbi:hypothetical protein AC579_8881 [Pseudocercospora musae]|uniref:Uncharacterized protein n=1 Tax=Pseudocercospora musae TaxID=113226 RepID=A0A139I714_9PEZI|nr:hypothetical protein AC579_8881 [Pseudocercospora musae]